ncbi:MAG TPA: 4Fe-4S single cluster domain-containing protein [Patescibacteria group bacterium]|nr:4Fe-4S single cluster domain-containing protein [Patescibacteria group bacterium]
MENKQIRLAAFVERSMANGPGCRAVIWVQGCHRRCPGCFNPAMLDFVGGQMIDVSELARQILAIDGIEGITLSGGEPLTQAGPLAQLAESLQRQGLNVVLFTGYDAKELAVLTDPDQRQLLAAVDLAVAGPYRQELPSRCYLCGSDNQELVFLSERLRWHPDLITGCDAVAEFIIETDGRIRVSGLLR